MITIAMMHLMMGLIAVLMQIFPPLEWLIHSLDQLLVNLMK